MKSKIKIISLAVMLFTGISITPQKASAQGASVSFQVFYDELSPYGQWVDNSEYGYVWIPDVAPGFTPYGTNGYWVFTEDGWTWVSDYPWGWAPFHYGRWFYDTSYGPMWVPDNQWGPGWVTWRRSEGYYGWAPIGPGISISIAYGNGYNPPYDHWRFVRENDFGRTNINNYCVSTTNNVTIINNSTVINNIHENKTRNVSYNAGPDRVEVEKHVGKTIIPVAIRENNKPGEHLNKGELQIYRPQVQNNNATGSKPTPAKVVSLKDVKPASQRIGDIHQQKENKPVQQQAQPKRDVKPVEQQQPSREGQPHRHPQQQVDPVKHEQVQPVRQEPQHNAPPKRIDRPQPPPEGQPVRHEQAMPVRENQPPKHEQPQPIREAQPSRQPQRDAQPARQEQPQPQREARPARQPHNNPSQHELQAQPQHENPSPKKEGERPAH